MGKFFASILKEMKLGFKTVTFQFKQYICFYVAILAMQVMFGIIVMASANDIAQHKESVENDYNYHFVITNLPAESVAEFERGEIANSIDDSPYFSSNVVDSFVYIKMDPDATGEQVERKSLSRLYEENFSKYLTKIEKIVKTTLSSQGVKDANDFEANVQFSPLYTLDEDVWGMRLECFVKLLILAIVSILVIILLFNIRVNHFKFMYGIYMSFGADTKKLFFTSFWEMMMIGLLTLIPAGGIAFGVDYYLYSTANKMDSGYIARLPLTLSPWLMAFAILFIIPVFLSSVYLPVKATASKPPLKLLLAEDNSNLVSSPRISTQLLGRKFPKAYEGLGLFRFRRYCATLVASSVLFASIFVWISFYRDVYDFNMNQDKAEFVVTSKKEVYKKPIRGDDVTVTLDNLRLSLSGSPEKYTKFKFFEEKYFLSGNYTITFDDKAYSSKIFAIRAKTGDTSNVIKTEEFVEEIKGAFAEKHLDFSENVVAIKYDSVFSEYLKMLNPANYQYEYDDAKREYRFYKIKFVDDERYYNLDQDDDIDPLIDLVSNYGKIYTQCVTKARDAKAYVAFHKSNVKMFTKYNNEVLDDMMENASSKRAGIAIDFFAANHDIVDYLSDPERGYEYDGNLDDILTEENQIIISETAANRKVLKIEPGDKITVAVLKEGVKVKTVGGISEDDSYLDRLMETDQFDYIEFTVCAVLKNMPTTENLPIYFNTKDYQLVTRNVDMGLIDSENGGINFNQFDIYLNAAEKFTPNDITDIHKELADWAQGRQVEITWNNAIAQANDALTRQNLPVIQIIALFALMLSPLFWFFSQAMFFAKREKEFEILRGMGAVESEIKRIFRKDGIIFALIGMAATFVLSVIGVYVIHTVNMSVVARFTKGATQLYQFHWEMFYTGYNGEPTFNILFVAIAAAVVLTGICGYLAAMIPYHVDKKKAKKRISHEFGE